VISIANYHLVAEIVAQVRCNEVSLRLQIGFVAMLCGTTMKTEKYAAGRGGLNSSVGT
jgi:hypothetical protein